MTVSAWILLGLYTLAGIAAACFLNAYVIARLDLTKARDRIELLEARNKGLEANLKTTQSLLKLARHELRIASLKAKGMAA